MNHIKKFLFSSKKGKIGWMIKICRKNMRTLEKFNLYIWSHIERLFAADIDLLFENHTTTFFACLASPQKLSRALID